MKKSLLAIVAMVAVAFTAVAAPVMSAIAPIQAGVVGIVKAAAERVHDVLFAYMARSGLVLGMTTLAVNKPRAYDIGSKNAMPVIAADIIYEGAAVGMVVGTGHARPLAAGDKFVGFAERQADNSAGAAAAINVEVVKSGQIELAVTGAVITDVGQPVYATDDDTFTFSPVDSVFVGFVKRYVSSGVAVVEFNAGVLKDPYGARTVRETLSSNKTLDAEDTGKLFWVDTDAFTITLPAVAAGVFGVQIVNGMAFGGALITISPNASDSILGPNITAADDKDLLNTKATAKRGDYVVLDSGDADGYLATELVGTWARQA